jgi:hypothetical protein
MRSPADDPPLFSGGDAFRYTRRGMDAHPWVVLSDPLEDGDHIVIANFTKWLAWKDQTCIVDPSECPAILTLRSCVEYAGCEVWKLGILESKLDNAQIQRLGNVGADILDRMRRGVIESPHSPYKARDILISQGLVADL